MPPPGPIPVDDASGLALAPSGTVAHAWSVLEGNLECKGLCQESCGPWVCSPEEGRLIERVAGKRQAEGIRCPYLEGGRCSIHAIRPTICRVWGQVESMPCRFGCRPSWMLSEQEAQDLVRTLTLADWSPWPDVEERHRAFNEALRAAGNGGASPRHGTRDRPTLE